MKIQTCATWNATARAPYPEHYSNSTLPNNERKSITVGNAINHLELLHRYCRIEKNADAGTPPKEHPSNINVPMQNVRKYLKQRKTLKRKTRHFDLENHKVKHPTRNTNTRAPQKQKIRKKHTSARRR